MSFWTEDGDDKHQQIAKTFYENIEYEHPDTVSSNRLSPYSHYSKWNRTAVKYYDYNGPNVQNIRP